MSSNPVKQQVCYYFSGALIVSTASQYLDSAEDSADIQCLLGNDQDSLRHSGALFILKMKEQRRMTQVAVDDIVEGYKSLFGSTVQCLKARVRAKLADEGLTSTLCDDVFEDPIFPFNGIETAHLQEKYFQESLGIIVSYSLSFQ